MRRPPKSGNQLIMPGFSVRICEYPFDAFRCSEDAVMESKGCAYCHRHAKRLGLVREPGDTPRARFRPEVKP